VSVTDKDLEKWVARLLRTGVILSGVIVVVGGALYLARDGGEIADYHSFSALPAGDRLLPKILSGAMHGSARAIIQAGILVLIATPILRVALSLVGFGLERDRTYAAITAIVLAVLLYSLISGGTPG
jgi:uncharacterized membrane protein